MSLTVNMLCGALLNNPGLLVGLIIAILVVIAGITAFFIMLPKIKASAKQKSEARQQAKEQAAKDRAEEENFAASLLAKDDEPIRKDLRQNDINNIVDTVQHNRKEPNAKVEIQKKEKDEHKEALSNDVISIMQGGVSSSSAFKTADAFGAKQAAEQEKVDEAKSEKRVEGVFSVLGGAPTPKPVEEKPKKTKTATKTTAKTTKTPAKKATTKKESK